MTMAKDLIRRLESRDEKIMEEFFGGEKPYDIFDSILFIHHYFETLLDEYSKKHIAFKSIGTKWDEETLEIIKKMKKAVPELSRHIENLYSTIEAYLEREKEQ